MGCCSRRKQSYPFMGQPFEEVLNEYRMLFAVDPIIASNWTCHLFFVTVVAFYLVSSLSGIMANLEKGKMSRAKHNVNSRKQLIPWRPEVFNSPRQILTLLNKVPGYWLQGETDLANKPRILQIFPQSKFGIDRTACLKVMAKKCLGRNLNFLAITYMPAFRLSPNFESRKICMFLGLLAKSVSA